MNTKFDMMPIPDGQPPLEFDFSDAAHDGTELKGWLELDKWAYHNIPLWNRVNHEISASGFCVTDRDYARLQAGRLLNAYVELMRVYVQEVHESPSNRVIVEKP